MELLENNWKLRTSQAIVRRMRREIPSLCRCLQVQEKKMEQVIDFKTKGLVAEVIIFNVDDFTTLVILITYNV